MSLRRRLKKPPCLTLFLHLVWAEVRVVNDTPQPTFVQAKYIIEIGEAERIAVDHVTRAIPADANSGAAQCARSLPMLYLLLTDSDYATITLCSNIAFERHQ